MTIQLYIREFFIFKTNHNGNPDTEYEKVLYFHPTWKSRDDQLAVVGLSEALMSFANFFSSSCVALHTRNGKQFFHQVSDHIWAVMTVAIVNPPSVSSRADMCEQLIDDDLISRKLSNICERFELLNGPLSFEPVSELPKTREVLKKFYDRELTMLDLSFRDVPDFIGAVRWKFCDSKYALELENLGTRITLSCPFPDMDIAIFHDAQLSWSSLPTKDYRAVLQYVLDEIMSLPPDLDIGSISPDSSHFGRFLTGPSDMGKSLCPAQMPVPVVFHRSPGSSDHRRLQLVVYRALRLTVCLIIDEKHGIPREFFNSFDATYGVLLTDLSCQLDDDKTESSLLASDLANLSLAIEATSGGQAAASGGPTPGAISSSSTGAISGFLVWEPEFAGVSTDLFVMHSGGRGEIVPAFAPLLPIFAAAKRDAVACFGKRWSESLLHLEPDVWLHLCRLNKREVFLIYIGKKVDISKVSAETKRFWVEKLEGLFRVS